MTKEIDMKAFPNGIITNKDGLIVGGQQGMDLRDWFAGLAMQTFIADAKGFNSGELAKFSYEMANLMMKEREK